MKELKLEKLQMFLETHFPKLREIPTGKYAARILVAGVVILVVGVIGFVSGSLTERLEGLKEVEMAVAQAKAKASEGRNLLTAILSANMERELNGLAIAWPRSKNQMSDDDEDIAGQMFTSATAYFRELLDIKNAGTSQRQPYVYAPLESVIDLETGRAKWIVVQGVTDEMDGCVPVLLSDNVDVDSLITAEGRHSIPASAKLRYTGKCAVVVLKCGATRVVREGRKDSLREIYGSTIELPTSLTYLKP